jgi:hypothetical protein
MTRHLSVSKLDRVKKLGPIQNLRNVPLTVIASLKYDCVVDDWRQSIKTQALSFL